MPVAEFMKYHSGTYIYDGGATIVPSYKDFAAYTVIESPAKVSRVKPVDVSSFSMANTPRTYFVRSRSWTEVGATPIWNGIELRPVAWNGGVGSWGVSLTTPYDIQTTIALKVKNQTANLGVTLAKYRELTTLWSAMAMSLGEVAAHLQRLRNPRNWYRLRKNSRMSPEVRRLFKTGSAVYLGYLFGLRQFSADFKAISDALRRRFEDPLYLQDSFTIPQRRETKRHGGGGTTEWFSTTTEILTTRVRFRYRVIPNDQVLAQVGITNPIAVIYDYIPFSFVLSWMIPIGRYLSTLDALQGVADLRWYYTESTVEESWVDYPLWGGASAGYRRESLTRSATSTGISPPLPRFAMSTQASNVVTGLALLGALQSNDKLARSALRIR